MSFLFRIGSKPVLVISLFLLVVFFSTCSDSSGNELAVFKALDESLVNSNKNIARKNEIVYMSMQEKLIDPATSIKAEFLQPKVMAVQQLSSRLVNYIERLKIDLKKGAGLKTEEVKESFRENDNKTVNTLFNIQGKGEELHDRLKKYKRDILAIDSQMAYIFKDILVLTTQSFDSLNETQQNLTKAFFENTPAVAALAMLSLFQNNAMINENRMINFLNDKMTSHFTEDYTTYSAIVAQNSTYVIAGEEIKITAGVGSFSLKDNLKVIVNGKSVPIGDDAVAIYKFKASGKTGKHIVPVEISYIDQEGKKQVIAKDVEYIVINKKLE